MRAIARRHRLLGAGPDCVAALKDPLAFAALCRAHGVPHPAVTREPVPDRAGLAPQAGRGLGRQPYPRRDRRAARRRAPISRPGCRAAPCALAFLADGAAIRRGGRHRAVERPVAAPAVPLCRRPGAGAPSEPPLLGTATSRQRSRGRGRRLAPATGLAGPRQRRLPRRRRGLVAHRDQPAPGRHPRRARPARRRRCSRQHIAASLGRSARGRTRTDGCGGDGNLLRGQRLRADAADLTGRISCATAHDPAPRWRATRRCAPCSPQGRTRPPRERCCEAGPPKLRTLLALTEGHP